MSEGKNSSLLVPTLAGLGIARAARVGAAALVLQGRHYKALSTAFYTDLAELEKSVSHLEHSLLG